MINICFSKSTRGLLMFTRGRSDTDNKIICIDDDLSIGDIRDINFDNRKNVLTYFYGYDDKSDFDWYLNTSVKKYYEEFHHIINTTSDEIIIWYSNSPVEYCGMLYTCYVLKEKSVDISMINCSQIIEVTGTTVKCCSTGEIHPEKQKYFFESKKEITQEEKVKYANVWERLIEENGELRTFENADIKTVDINFYDEYILKQITSTPILVGRAVGMVMEEIRESKLIGIGHGLLISRIKHLIETGVLGQIGEEKSFFENMIFRR